jgi:dTDP-4-dehydrorhamnose 3,5-epimerase
MQIQLLALQGLAVATSQSRQDHRGAFMRLFCTQELNSVIGSRNIVQINHSLTTSLGAIRGMHYQTGSNAEMKLVRCLRGAVYDVAVDVRPDSPTYLQHHAIELHANDGKLFVIPEGFAHGFQSLIPDTELLYLHTAPYHQASEAGLRYDDPRLNIAWPLPASDISVRDLQHPLIARTTI